MDKGCRVYVCLDQRGILRRWDIDLRNMWPEKSKLSACRSFPALVNLKPKAQIKGEPSPASIIAAHPASTRIQTHHRKVESVHLDVFSGRLSWQQVSNLSCNVYVTITKTMHQYWIYKVWVEEREHFSLTLMLIWKFFFIIRRLLCGLFEVLINKSKLIQIKLYGQDTGRSR